MRTILSQSTSNRMMAFCTGFGVTALLQSATATTLMTASFVAKNMMSLRAAIAIVIGADLSTTILAQILSFDLRWLAPALFIIGASLNLRKNANNTTRAVGQVIVGLGLVLLALSLIRSAALPLQSSAILQAILSSLKSDPAMAVLFSTLLTVLIHSSLATVLFFASLASQNILDLHLGLYLIVGANIGGSLIPYLATYKDGIEKKRLMVANIAMRFTVALIILAGHLPLIAQLEHYIPDTTRALVALHTGFNLLLAALFLPFVATLSHQMTRLFKSPKRSSKSKTQSYLDESHLDRPSLALSSAVRETLRMADLIQEMTEKSFSALKTNDKSLLTVANKLDNQLDQIFKRVTFFLTRLNQDTLTQEESAQYERIMSFATNLEHSGDIVQHSLSKTIAKKIKIQENFSDAGWQEIKSFYMQVMANIKTSQSVFISQSLELSEDLIRAKKHLKEVELISRRNHFNRISEKNPYSIVTTGVHIDLMRDLGRINSYVTSVAYETLNAAEAQESQG